MSKFFRSASFIISLAVIGFVGWLAGYFFVSKIAPELALNIENRNLARLESQSASSLSLDPAGITPTVLGEKIENEPAFLNEDLTTAASPIKIFLAGDIMLSRWVEKRALAQTSTDPFDYPFVNFQNQIAAADLAFANLETPLIAGAPVSDGAMIFRASPSWTPALKSAGFDALSLANNHILNQKQAGLLKTQSLLTEQGINNCGIGNTSTSGTAIFTIKDLKIGVACFTYDGVKKIGATLAPLGTTAENLKRELAYLKDQQVDFIIVSMHSGAEYAATANPAQTQFARQAVDLGADLVVGHHPHVVQNMELYKGKYIFYSLGNFIFDQMWSDATRRGLALVLTVEDATVVAIEYLPVVIENYSQPRPANPAESDWILKRLKWAAALGR